MHRLIFWRGKSYLVLGDYEKSINDFNSAIKIFPTAEDYYWRAKHMNYYLI